MRVVAGGVLFLLWVLPAVLTPGAALAAKLEHTKVVPPKIALPAPEELKTIGVPTRFLEHGGIL